MWSHDTNDSASTTSETEHQFPNRAGWNNNAIKLYFRSLPRASVTWVAVSVTGNHFKGESVTWSHGHVVMWSCGHVVSYVMTSHGHGPKPNPAHLVLSLIRFGVILLFGGFCKLLSRDQSGLRTIVYRLWSYFWTSLVGIQLMIGVMRDWSVVWVICLEL